MKVGAHQRQRFDWLRQQKHPRPAFSPEHHKSLPGVFPEPPVGGQLVEGPQQVFNLVAAAGERQRHRERFNQMPVRGQIDPVVGHIAVGRQCEGQTGCLRGLKQITYRCQCEADDYQAVGTAAGVEHCSRLGHGSLRAGEGQPCR